MKILRGFKITLYLIPLLLISSNILANELDSTNFKLIGVSTTGGGAITESTNYNMLSTIGQISADPRTYSTNYRLNIDPSATFTATQPTIQCFETDTDGTTECTSGPTELLTYGMVGICGMDGCYDSARFEIEPYNNPPDTLYMVQISTDNFVSDIKCLDGSTFKPKTLSNCDINDFRTEENWEDEDLNVKGLLTSTKHYIRISALHGDFTQSDFSLVRDATTTSGFLEFDIDIAYEGGYDPAETETSPPYVISFTEDEKLVVGAPATTAYDLIWLDATSSSRGGMAILLSGKYGGLYSPTTTELIESDTENLDDSNAEGFGLQSYYVNYEQASYYGDIITNPDYVYTPILYNTVGKVSTTPINIYDGDGPIMNGRMGMYVKARASVSRTPAEDYTEEISFIMVPRY